VLAELAHQALLAGLCQHFALGSAVPGRAWQVVAADLACERAAAGQAGRRTGSGRPGTGSHLLPVMAATATAPVLGELAVTGPGRAGVSRGERALQLIVGGGT
jgi:hypothetical protein